MYTRISNKRKVIMCGTKWSGISYDIDNARRNTLLASESTSHARPCLWLRPVYLPKFNPLNAELNPIYYLLALLAHHFLHVSRIRVKSLTLRLLMSYIYIYGAPILDVSRSHTTTQHDLSRWAACGRSPAEIVGSNPSGGMDICLLWVSCVVR